MKFVQLKTVRDLVMLVASSPATEGSFITYNSYKGEIGSSEKIASEPNMNSFPIIEIMNQNLIPEEMLETVAGL